MCGIAGFYNNNAEFLSQPQQYEDILTHMAQALRHRGPDDNGSILCGKCGLSHTRLAIIDPENAVQPMTKELSMYHYHIVYNGEIYNLKELKTALKERGVTPVTDSDTEVLLLSFIEFGAYFIKKADGIFAMAVYDERHSTLTLFRDSFGVKPLFYTFLNDNTFVFSSEIKGLFCYPGVGHTIDRNGLNEILGLGPARTPGSGVFKNIFEVMPGSYLTITPSGVHTTLYYRLESQPHTDSYETTLEKVRFYVTDAIRRQMVSDVPICTFLSGGVDSSVVSAICAKEMKKDNERLKTFSFDFVNNSQYFKANTFQPSMDKPFVEKMVVYLDSDHTYLECDNLTQADYLYRSVAAHDLPCMADIDSSLLYFCEKVSQSHKVVLTGECADEVFGGYPWFHKEEFLKNNTFPWTPSLQPRKALLSKEILLKLHMDDYVKNAYDNAINEIDILPKENEIQTSRRRISYLNIRFFMQTLLNRMDRTSMSCGLEARVPFADRRLVDYVFNIPWEMKAKDGIVKNILRSSCRGLLPDEILFRRKSPYPKTYNPYYEELLASRLKKVMEQKDSVVNYLFDKDSLKNFVENPKDYAKPWYGQLMAGPQMMAYILQMDYFFKYYNVQLEDI